MAIGNPVTLTSNVASKTISVIATAGQTLFTVTGGYRINQLAVFRNGVRLLDSRDYEARNGATVTLLSAATVGDALEFQVFDDFRVADAIVSAESEQTISGNLTVSGILTATDLRGSDVTFRHVKATGISTVSDTTQSTTTTTGALIVSGGLGVAKNLFVGGSMNVAGTLTYEDVTNSETAGVTTTGGLVVTGLGATFGSGVGIADSIYHIDDSNTAIRFPAADTFTVTTAGSEALRVDSSGNTGINCTSGGGKLAILANASTYEGLELQTPSGDGSGEFHIGVHQAGSTSGRSIVFKRGGADGMDTESLRIASNGHIGIGTDDPQTEVQIDASTETTLSLFEDGRKFGALQVQGSSNFGTILYSYNGNPLIFSTNSGTGFDRALTIDTSQRLLVGSSSARANFNNGTRTAFLQLEGTSSDIDSSSLALIYNQNSTGNASNIYFGKTRGGSIGDNSALNAANDRLGNISFQGNDGTQFVDAAHIRAFTDGTPGADDMPGRLVFSTTADGASSPTERMRISSDGTVRIGDGSVNAAGVGAGPVLSITGAAPEITLRDSATGTPYAWMATNDAGSLILAADQGNNAGSSIIDFRVDGTQRLRIDSSGRLLIGHTSSINITGVESQVQVVGTDTEQSSLSLARFVNDSGEPFLIFAKSRNGTKGGNTVVQDDDTLGRITFQGADGTDYEEAAYIKGEVDGTPADEATDMPGRLLFGTTANGDHNATERLRIDSNGNFIFKNGALIENGFHDDGGGITGDYNHDLGTYGNVHYAATNPAGSYTYNLRINSSTSVNSVMAEGDTLSFTFINNISGNTGRYMTAFKIDGTTQTVEWAGGSGPSENSGSGSDVYSFTIIKTGNAAFKVFGSFTNHD